MRISSACFQSSRSLRTATETDLPQPLPVRRFQSSRSLRTATRIPVLALVLTCFSILAVLADRDMPLPDAPEVE